MHPALWISKSGLDAQNYSMSILSNNLANANTPGFKRDRALFEDLMYQNIKQPGAQNSQSTLNPSGFMLGTGVQVKGSQKLFDQGSLTPSSNTLDVAISGNGFFQITLPDNSVAYTRAGQFQLDVNGKIVNSDGYPITPSITVPKDAVSISIGSDGIVTTKNSASAAPTQIGTIPIYNFVNPAGLQPKGQNLYLETASSGQANTSTPGTNGLGLIQQGFNEGSNVNVVEDLVGLIQTQRAYEMNGKAMSAVDEELKFITQNLQ